MAGTPPNWLDSNVFIQAKNGPYKEIVTNEEPGDDLAKWMKTRRQSGLFVEPDADVQKATQKVADYVMENYEQQHAAEFVERSRSVADCARYPHKRCRCHSRVE